MTPEKNDHPGCSPGALSGALNRPLPTSSMQRRQTAVRCPAFSVFRVFLEMLQLRKGSKEVTPGFSPGPVDLCDTVILLKRFNTLVIFG